MTPRSASLRVAHQRDCQNRNRTALDSVGRRSGCTCKPSFYTFQRGPDGKPRKGPRVKTKAEALKALHAAQVDLDQGRAGTRRPEEVTLGEWADQYEELVEKRVRAGELQPRTLEAYRESLAIARLALGSVRLRRIGPAELRSFYECFETQRPATRLRHLRHLGACLSAAVAYGKLDTNPLPAFRKSLGLKAPRQGHAPFEDAELARLWLALRHYEPVMLAACRFSAESGLRIGEIVGLSWNDVDLSHGRIYLVSGTKGARYREFPLTRQARRVLEQWVRIAGAQDSGPVFGHPFESGRLPKRLLQDRLEKAMGDAGVPRLHPTARDRVTGERLPRSFHSLRFSAANLMRRRGLPDAFAQEVLGHSTAELTRMYGTYTPDQLETIAASARRRR